MLVVVSGERWVELMDILIVLLWKVAAMVETFGYSLAGALVGCIVGFRIGCNEGIDDGQPDGW